MRRCILEKYRKVLKQCERKHAKSLLDEYGLICKQMKYGDEVASLYIAKKHWTNRFDQDRSATIGIFFCIWTSSEMLENQEYAYNIHSIKLRKLPGYKLASREFASDFREAVKSRIASWPNIKTNFGPLTLLEGRDNMHIDSFDQNVEERILDFVGIHEEIDNLLQMSVK